MTPGRMFSITMSVQSHSRRATLVPSFVLRLTVTPYLESLKYEKHAERLIPTMPSLNGGCWNRKALGGLTALPWKTCAPKFARYILIVGHAAHAPDTPR